MINDKYYTVIRWGELTHRPNRITIEATYGDHIWSGPQAEVIGYADTRKEAQKLATNARVTA